MAAYEQTRLDFGPAGNWTQIESRARDFVDRWRGETYERGESQSFWTEFLAVFGVDRKRVASFEYRTRKLSGAPGYVDLFWPGRLLAEQKSAGRDLDAAMDQALGYLPKMPDYELPRAVVVSDFATFDLLMLDTSKHEQVRHSFALEELPRRVRRFSFLFDPDEGALSEQNPVNVKAAQDISDLHEKLKDQGYRGKDLELLLTRVVFCLFAEDTGIFKSFEFRQFVKQTYDNGSNTGQSLISLFEILNTAEADRQANTPQLLTSFPYVNGGLFAQQIRTPMMDTASRRAILTATQQSWSEVNPSIFGSMFQGVMDETERRNLGAHYTSEKNILRVIQPLFLDDLYAEFDAARGNRAKLERLHDKIANLTFLDPACGSGNFLVITYRELRRLEHKLIDELRQGQQMLPIDIASYIRVTPDQMFGIELEQFPAQVAQLALWLTAHQMNMEAARLFGGDIAVYADIPIRSQPHIVCANALRTDWGDVVELSDLDYIIGNPPFNGSRTMSSEQKDDLYVVTDGMREQGFLDFVTGWFFKAGRIMKSHPNVRSAFVATNSISQGEQVGILWQPLLKLGMTIDFAHQTFKWSNDAPGVAAVFCVIVGFSKGKKKSVRMFEYPDIRNEPIETGVSRINPYLNDGPDILVRNRQEAPDGIPEMHFGAMPRDGGHFIVSPHEREEILSQYPEAEPLIRPYIGAEEFINGKERYCLWLLHADQALIDSIPFVIERVEQVRAFRLKSKAASTRKFAETPNVFAQIRESRSEFILVPRVSSERRDYVPMGFLPSNVIASDAVQIIPNATRYHFGILTSRMHMAWMRLVAGRLEGRYRYSKDIVYNNFPWPEGLTEVQRQRIESLAQAVLDARAQYPQRTLAQLYDPAKMPGELLEAHRALDAAVDKLYRAKPFADDAERVALLLRRYQELVGKVG